MPGRTQLPSRRTLAQPVRMFIGGPWAPGISLPYGWKSGAIPPDWAKTPLKATALEATTGSVKGWCGDGCFVQMCVYVGQLPPLDDLPFIVTEASTFMELRLAEGSSFDVSEPRYVGTGGNPIIPVEPEQLSPGHIRLAAPPPGTGYCA